MAATPLLNDPATPVKLRDMSEALVKAVDRDDRGRIHHLKLELARFSASIREEVRRLQGRADPDLLIALWSSAQMPHARGLEYASEGSRPDPAVIQALATAPAQVLEPLQAAMPVAVAVSDSIADPDPATVTVVV